MKFSSPFAAGVLYLCLAQHSFAQSVNASSPDDFEKLKKAFADCVDGNVTTILDEIGIVSEHRTKAQAQVAEAKAESKTASLDSLKRVRVLSQIETELVTQASSLDDIKLAVDSSKLNTTDSEAVAAWRKEATDAWTKNKATVEKAKGFGITLAALKSCVHKIRKVEKFITKTKK